MTSGVPPSCSARRGEGVYRGRPARGAVVNTDGSHRDRRPESSDGSPARLTGQTWKRHVGVNYFPEKGERCGIPGWIVTAGHPAVAVDGCGAAVVVGTTTSASENLVGERWPDAGGDTGESRT